MEKTTQKKRVIKKLIEKGSVNNFWAFHNYILRLGAIIYELRNDGWEIDGAYGKELKKNRKFWKNYYYTVKSKPKDLAQF